MILIALLHLAKSITIAIDLGCDSIKIAYRKLGYHQSISFYKPIPNIFAYSQKDVWAFGEGAISQCRSEPDSCIQNIRIPLNDYNYYGNSIKGYQIVALELGKIKKTIENNHNNLAKVVYVIPPTMTIREKSYLYSAAMIANINCVQFITSTYAPIGFLLNEQKSDLSFDSAAVFIDIGHLGVRLSGFIFGNNQVSQKLNLYNDNIGGKTIDENMFKLFTGQHKITYDKKDQYILLSKLKKAREQLTNQKTTTITFKGQNFTITRETLEVCCKEIKEALSEMLTVLTGGYSDLLKSGKLWLFGGCSQIPCLIEFIQNFLPKMKIYNSVDTFSAFSKGAIYVYDQQNDVQHFPLVTFESTLKTENKLFNLFTRENFENYGPVIQFENIDQSRLFIVYDKTDNNNEFYRFTIKTPSKSSENKIELEFSLNYFLIPVLESFLVNKYIGNTNLEIQYQNIGWEVSSEFIERSKEILKEPLQKADQVLEGNFNCSKIENVKKYFDMKLKKFIFTNWRRLAFPLLKKNLDNNYKSCLEENEYECPEWKINEIVEKFKSYVSHYLKINIDDFDNHLIDDNL